MKKYCLIAGIMIAAGLLGGCNMFTPRSVNTEEGTVTEQKGDYDEVLPVTAEDVEFYRYMDGSSSVYTEYGIYKYNGSFVFMGNYFNCGNYFTETYALTEEQQEAFIEALNQCSQREEEEEEETDGGHSSYGDVSVNGILYGVSGLDLEKLKIELQENPVMIEDLPEELAAYEEADLTQMRAEGSRNISIVSIGAIGEPAYIQMINEQIEEEISDAVTKVTVTEENEQDFVMELETENQGIYYVTVTYLGYVADIRTMEQKEGEPEENGQTGTGRIVMVNGELYQDTGRISTADGRCGNMDGSIDSEVGEDEIPTEDNQSNFGTGYGYQYGPEEGTIEIYLDDEWRVFERI